MSYARSRARALSLGAVGTDPPFMLRTWIRGANSFQYDGNRRPCTGDDCTSLARSILDAALKNPNACAGRGIDLFKSVPRMPIEWFAKSQEGFFSGCGTGIFGGIYSPLCTMAYEESGWQKIASGTILQEVLSNPVFADGDGGSTHVACTKYELTGAWPKRVGPALLPAKYTSSEAAWRSFTETASSSQHLAYALLALPSDFVVNASAPTAIYVPQLTGALMSTVSKQMSFEKQMDWSDVLYSKTVGPKVDEIVGEIKSFATDFATKQLTELAVVAANEGIKALMGAFGQQAAKIAADFAVELVADVLEIIPIIGTVVAAVKMAVDICKAIPSEEELNKQFCDQLGMNLKSPIKTSGTQYVGTLPCDVLARDNDIGNAFYAMLDDAEYQRDCYRAGAYPGSPEWYARIEDRGLDPRIVFAAIQIGWAIRKSRAFVGSSNAGTSDGGASLWPVYLDLLNLIKKKGGLNGNVFWLKEADGSVMCPDVNKKLQKAVWDIVDGWQCHITPGCEKVVYAQDRQAIDAYAKQSEQSKRFRSRSAWRVSAAFAFGRKPCSATVQCPTVRTDVVRDQSRQPRDPERGRGSGTLLTGIALAVGVLGYITYQETRKT